MQQGSTQTVSDPTGQAANIKQEWHPAETCPLPPYQIDSNHPPPPPYEECLSSTTQINDPDTPDPSDAVTLQARI